MKIICFDIGKTKILSSVAKVSRKKYKFLEIIEQKNPRNPRKIEKLMFDFSKSARRKYWTKKVAISAAHLVDFERKTVSQGKKCYGADIFDFKFLEKEKFSVKIENDGRCFALGEYFFGKGQKEKNVLVLVLGTEIGGGYIAQGKNFQGAHFSAMEASHVRISQYGRWKEWWELAGGSGIEKMHYLAAGEKFPAKDIFDSANKGNIQAKKTVREASGYLGIGTANLVTILDPDRIIFGGSLSKQKRFINNAVRIARKNIFNKKANYKFAISSLGNKANLLGAASLYF